MRELVHLLQDYLLGAKGIGECAEWMAGVNWDDPDLTDREKDSLGLFELLITDVAEGLREELEFWEEASQLIAKTTRSTFTWQAFPEVPIAVDSASSRAPQIVVEVKVEARVSRSWNISPLAAPSS